MQVGTGATEFSTAMKMSKPLLYSTTSMSQDVYFVRFQLISQMGKPRKGQKNGGSFIIFT